MVTDSHTSMVLPSVSIYVLRRSRQAQQLHAIPRNRFGETVLRLPHFKKRCRSPRLGHCHGEGRWNGTEASQPNSGRSLTGDAWARPLALMVSIAIARAPTAVERRLRHLHRAVIARDDSRSQPERTRALAAAPVSPHVPARPSSAAGAGENHHHLRVRRLAATFGAEVGGLDLTAGWNDALVGDLRAALAEHKLLVIPGQAGLSAGRLQAFAELFGRADRAAHPNWEDADGTPGVKKIRVDIPPPETPSASRDGYWHTDGPPRELTQWYTFLHAVEVPEFGRDTLFADMTAAFERLSPPLQDFLCGLSAQNEWDRDVPAGYVPAVHPVVMTDPTTGQRSLYVNQLYTTKILGLRREESRMLLDHLFSQANVPELQLRVQWERGSLVVWDNERTLHYAVRDMAGDRLMHRVMINTGR